MSVDLRAELETAFKSDAAVAAGFVYTNSRDTRVGRRRESPGDAGDKVFPVYLQWGGRSNPGVRTRFHRSIWQVIVVLDPMDTPDPWKNADAGVDGAMEIIYTVPGTFPELLPIVPLELSPAGGRQGGGKSYACAVISVVGP